jgi:AcrR family transcriptional regulator
MKKLPARRAPIQARAEKRRDSLLDAAARLLAREGWDAVSTSAIAREANAAVGTVYDYFPDKAAVLASLLARYRERLLARVQGALTDASHTGRDALVERTVRAFADFYRSEPGYLELWLGSQLVAPLREAGAEWGDDATNSIALFMERALGAPKKRARLAARALIHGVSAIVTAALAGPARDREVMIDEAVALAQAYAASIGAPPRRPKRASR